jgi:hypothetical protein
MTARLNSHSMATSIRYILALRYFSGITIQGINLKDSKKNYTPYARHRKAQPNQSRQPFQLATGIAYIYIVPTGVKIPSTIVTRILLFISTEFLGYNPRV